MKLRHSLPKLTIYHSKKRAQARIAEINTPSPATGEIKETFINFTQKRWVQFAFSSLVLLIAFLLSHR
jgi:hypothetical protein